MEKAKRLLSEIHYRKDGSIRDYKKKYDRSGCVIDFVTEVHYIPPHKVKVLWYDQTTGNEVTESFDGNVKHHMFQVFAEGINTELVESVEFPTLDYNNNGDYLVKIVVKVLED